MKMKYKFGHYFAICSLLLLLILVFTSKDCLSQVVIKLDDVAKFELVTRSGGLSSNYRKIDIILESDGWKAYQTGIKRSTLQGLIDNTSKVFIKDVPSKLLNQWLRIITKQDTGIHIDLFKINATELVNVVKGINGGVTQNEKDKFMKLVQSKGELQNALKQALTPFIMDDRTYYGITITTKKNKSFTIKAYSFADLYNLPWKINTVKSYDPNISLIFEFISGNDNYPIQEKRRLYLSMGKFLFKEY